MTSRSILHVIEDLKPESGGPTTVVVELARHQARSGARVSVVCGSGPDQASQRAQLQASFEADGVALHVLASADRAPSRRRLRELIQTTGAEVVHLHGMWSSIVRLGAAEARRAGLPYVISTHGFFHP
jgi:glycosyltransferase involved in cell wall biosynthesis